MKNQERVVEYFDCSCRCPAHTIRLEYDPEFLGQNISFCYYLDLTHLNFFQRLWLAVKMLFRASDLDYCFHDVIIENRDIPRMVKFLSKCTENENEA